MNVFFDNIIFSLQKSGGISLYWYELIKNFPTQNVNIQFLENKKIDNLFRNQLNIQDRIIHHRSEPIIIDRFTPVRIYNDSIKPTIFHSSYYRRLQNKSENVKEVITLHDLTEIEYSNFTRYVHKKQIIKAIHQADGIICISDKTKSDLLQHFPEVNNKPVKVINHGITSHYRMLTEKELIRLTKKLELQHLLDKDNIVLYVGNRKARYKNFLPMVKALKNTDYKLIIAGGGELSRKELILLNNNLPNRYYAFANISFETLNILYNISTCLIYPSSNEGFGIPLLEALKAGCPYIIIDNPIPELLPNELGVCIEDINAYFLIHAIEKCIQIKRTQTQIFQTYQDAFQWKDSVNRTYDFYKKVVEE